MCKMKNKKGFTLVELLAVFVILGVLLMIAIPAVNGYLKKGAKSYYQALETDVMASGKDYLLNYKSLLPREIGNSSVINIDELVNNKYIDEIKDEDGNKCTGTITTVKTGKDKYDYHICLDCGENYHSSETECNYVGNNNESRNYAIDLNGDLASRVKQCDDITIPYATVKERTGGKNKVVTDKLEASPKTIDTTKLGTVTLKWTYRTKSLAKNVEVIDTVKPVIDTLQLRYTSGTGYNGEITNKDVIIHINASDYACKEKHPNLEGSGLRAVYYKEKRESNWRVYNTTNLRNTVKIDKTLWGTMQIKVVDKSGNESDIRELKVQTDKTKPTKTVVTYLGGKSTEKWQNNIKIKLSATDDIEIGSFEIYKDGSHYKTIGADGNFTPPNNFSSDNVVFRAVDTSGNKGAFSNIQKLHMDTENPSKTIVNLNGYVSGNWTNKDVKQTFSGTDNVGIEYYEYSYNTAGTTGTRTSNPWIENRDGQYIIYVRAVDYAGNRGAWSDAYIIRRDTVKPSCSLTYVNPPTMANGYFTNPVSVGFLTATDNFSGVKKTSLNKTYISYTTLGETITGTIVDNAGNSNTCTINVKVDVTTPSPSVGQNPISLGNGAYTFSSNVRPGWGPSGGSVVCNPANSRGTGTYGVSCTVYGANGRNSSVSFTARHSYPATPYQYTYQCNYVSRTCRGKRNCHTESGESCHCNRYGFCWPSGVESLCCEDTSCTPYSNEVCDEYDYECGYWNTCTGTAYTCPNGGNLSGTTCYY